MKITYIQTVIQVEFPNDDTTFPVRQTPPSPKDAFGKLLEKLRYEQQHGRSPEIWKEEQYVALLSQ